MAVQLPDELIFEILSILPAKSLLRFQLVCKSWLNLINSTKFKLMHLHNFNKLNPRYLVRRLDYYENDELYDVHLDDEAFSFDDATLIEFPLAPIRVNPCFRIIGCCNGVVCLSDDNDDEGDAFSLDAIILWNPSVRRKLTLPLPIFYSASGFKYPYFVLGFGYDNISDDYKVVSLTYEQYSSTIRPKVEVYTVKTGIWRELIFPHNLRCYRTNFTWSPIFSNGSMHWFACDPTPGVKHYSIMTFDITTDRFGEIQLPEFLSEVILTVSVVGESLAVICSLNLESGSLYIVWVMKEYKNPASWTFLYHMRYPKVDLGKPLQLRNNGDMIVELVNRDMILYNHNDRSYVKVFADFVEEEDFDCRTYGDRYEESLALLDVGDSVPNKEAMKALMMVEKQESGHGQDNVAQHE